MKLTQVRIDGLKCPAGKRDMLVFDDEQRGLGVRVTASGGKTFLAQYAFPRTKSAVSRLAHAVPSRSPRRATLFGAIMGEVAKGIDPAAERKKAAAGGPSSGGA